MAREVKAVIDESLLKIAEVTARIQDFDGHPESLARKLEEYDSSIQHLYSLRDGLTAHDGTLLEVPVELLKSIDEGENLDAFTEIVFRSSLAANQACKGKVEAIRELHQAVDKIFRESFPSEMKNYDVLRGDTQGP